MKNLMGRTDFLRNLAPGESAVWLATSDNVEIDMRAFTATAHRLNVKISQQTAMMVSPGKIPVICVTVSKL